MHLAMRVQYWHGPARLRSMHCSQLRWAAPVKQEKLPKGVIFQEAECQAACGPQRACTE